MNDLPALSIRRPVLILVLNLLIAIAGIAAFFAVEVRELPDVDSPKVSVRGEYPGASPETMDAEVTSLVENAVARVPGVKSIESSSEENNFRMRAEFAATTDLATAASDVREAVSRVARDLPDAVERLTVVKAEEDADPIISIAATSDTLSDVELTRRLQKDVLPELLAAGGVADTPLFGNLEQRLRVVVDPLQLTRFGLSVSDVSTVLRNAQFDVPTGSYTSESQELLVRAEASVIAPDAIEDITIRNNTRIGDVADVFYGPEDAVSKVRLNGQPVIGIGIVRQAQSNTIEISNQVGAALKRLNSRFDDLELKVMFDEAVFIRGAVWEVLITLSLTVLIVIGIIWLFMGSIRATLVPSVAIPVALIGTLAAIWLMGFSINIVTLLALVLATGMVVDDAVVVLENIQRHRSEGLPARAGALIGTRQVFFAVIATTAVLVSVFVPISFLPSTAGRLFREFGFVLSVAVLISSFVALSLVPTLAARIPAERHHKTGLRAWLRRLGGWAARGYQTVLGSVLNHAWLALIVAILLASGAGFLFDRLPRELVPDEDRGLFYVNGTGPDGVGLQYTDQQVAKIENRLRPLVDKHVAESLFSIVGRYDLNRGRVTLPLAPWQDRTLSQQQIMNDARPRLDDIPGMRISLSSTNSLDLHNAGDGLEVALLGNNYLKIYEAAKKLARAIETNSEQLSEPRISYQPTQPQLSVSVDRRRAADLGIDLDDLANTLRAMVDGEELVDLNVDDQAVPILLESSQGAIRKPGDLVNIYVRNNAGSLLPLSTIVSLREEGVAAQLDRHAQRRAVEIDAQVGQGVSLQSAVDEIQAMATQILPDDVSVLLLGEAAALQETSQEVLYTYLLALVVVFLVLCAQFESFNSALVVVLLVPFGLSASVYALYLTGTSINIYSQIGLILLIGLMAKNSILLVEFADQMRDQGSSIREAIERSTSVRLRPVAMTMMSTTLGGLPLILSDGAGAEARHAIGWVVFGGLGLAALFTLFLTPVVYFGLARFSRPRAAESQRLEAEMADADSARQSV